MGRRKLDLLLLVPILGAGGAERQCARLAASLDPDRFSITVGVGRDGGSYESDLPAHVELRTFGAAAARRSSTLSVASALPGLVRWMHDRRPDVICAFVEPAHLLAWAARQVVRPAPKLVLGIQVALTERYRSASRFAPMPALVRGAHRRADLLIALSRGVAADLRRFDPGGQTPIETVYNAGVDARMIAAADAFTPERPEDRPVLVACGRLDPQKDYATCLRALAEVRRHHDAVLWVLGEGPERPRLEALASSLGVGDAVVWLGFQTNPFPYIRAADLFVLSSRFEGFAMVLTEAMALGTPVVSTDCPHGPREILDGGRYGPLVPPGDPASLARAILGMLEDGAERGRLTRESTARAHAFSAERSADGYAQVFEQLVPPGSRGYG